MANEYIFSVSANKRKFPCTRDCPKRRMGCHSCCEEFIEAKEKHDKEMEEIRKIKARENEIKDYAVVTHERIMKRINMR